MKRRLKFLCLVGLILSFVGCTDNDQSLRNEVSQKDAEIGNLKKQLDEKITENKEYKKMEKQDKSKPTPTGTSQQAQAATEPEEKLSVRECWLDYCPCEKTPDYGYIDVSLCRKIQAGMYVSDDEFNAGATSRDARKSIREFNEIEDTNF